MRWSQPRQRLRSLCFSSSFALARWLSFVVRHRQQFRMGTTHQEVGPAHARQNAAIGNATGVAVTLLAVYLLGYAVLCSLDYFDLARLPYAPHTDDWLSQLYRPLEWLRHL